MKHRLSDIIAEMEKIERTALEREIQDDERVELSFIRLLRNAFTEFLEAKGWVETVGTDHWRGVNSNDGVPGLRFTVQTNHPDFGEVEMTVSVKRGCN
jgi:hypothetical protein